MAEGEMDMMAEEKPVAVVIAAKGDGTFMVMEAPDGDQDDGAEPQIAQGVDQALEMARGLLEGEQSEGDMRSSVQDEVYGKPEEEAPPGELNRKAMQNGQARRF